MAQEIIFKKINKAAVMWEKTKNQKYKDLWYKLIKEWANGSDCFKRRNLSVTSCHQADDGTYVFVGKSRLL
jgi:hypothetical protein